MQLGRFTIEQLSEGHFQIFPNGTLEKPDISVFKQKINDDYLVLDDSIPVGIDPVLVTDGKYVILLDAGIGLGLDSKSPIPDISNLKTNLEIFGITPDQVTHVILTHLHYDHVAGLTYTDIEARTYATLPNAKIYVQKREWDYALSTLEQKTTIAEMGYYLDELYRLVANGQFIFIQQDLMEIVPGIDVLYTGGHTPGHQIIRIRDYTDSAYYFGDLIPSEDYLNPRLLKNADTNPEEARLIKMHLLRQAHQEKAFILFYHSLYTKNGRLIKDTDRRFSLKEDW